MRTVYKMHKTYGELEDFLLVMWKNLVLKYRRFCSTAIEIFVPVISCLFALLVMSQTKRIEYKTRTYPGFYVTNDSPPIATIQWSPCGNPFLRSIMKNVVKLLKVEEECFNNSKVLRSELQFSEASKTVGVQFDDALGNQTNISKHIDISLRFEEKPFLYYYYWRTNLLFPTDEVAGPRDPDYEHGAVPYYYEDGFLTLQHALALEIIRTKSSKPIPMIQMQRFPYPAWTSYEELNSSIDIVMFMLIFGFIFIYGNTIRCVAVEKESQVKEIMKIMGLTSWIHWTTWFLTAFIVSLIPVIVIIILLKTRVIIGANACLFPLTSPIILLFFFMSFSCATIAFAFAVSVFFSRAITANIVGVIVYIGTAFPYLPTKLSAVQNKIAACLLSNTAFGHGLKVIASYESLEESLTFSTFFSAVSPDKLSIGFICFMLIIDTVVYMLIALYVEAVFPGEYGLPKVWYFPFTKSFWRNNSGNDENAIQNESVIYNELQYEVLPSDAKIGIKLVKIRKKYGKNKVVLDDISLNILEGEITVLLGHNGAGKTTTASILTGILPATRGTALVDGHNVQTDMRKIRGKLGFCPQRNVLWDNLTVKQHLYFFAKLKGLREPELSEDINKNLELFDLYEKRKTRTRHLSKAMKRKLSVGIALSGNSKICIFDEPTAETDRASTKQLWNIIRSQKEDRTIFLTTCSVEEADCLGDRIGILTHGHLQCFGSSSFLKKYYGSGYRLLIIKLPQASVDRITEALQRYIPSVEVEQDNTKELSYILPEDETPVFEKLLRELEYNGHNLGVQSFSITLATMEELFMKVGIDYAGAHDDQYAGSVSDYILTNNKYFQETRVSGFQLYSNQLLAMLMKKILITWRSYFFLLFHIFTPLLFTILFMHYLKKMKEMRSSPALAFTLRSYNEPITVITTSDKNNSYYKHYKKLLQDENQKFIDWGTGDMNTYMLKKTTEDIQKVRRYVIIGATFLENNTIVAWFNNQPYHSPPLTLQYALNSVLKHMVGADYIFKFNNLPSHHTIDTKDEMGEWMHVAIYSLLISICMCYVASYYITFYVRERICGAKHLQFVSGLAVSAFWLIAFLWDFIIFLLISASVVIMMWLYNASLCCSSLMLLLTLFGFAMLPMTYIMSFVFRRASSGYSALNLLCFLLGPVTFSCIYLMYPGIHSSIQMAALYQILLLVPHFNLASAVANLTTIYFARSICEQTNYLRTILNHNETRVSDKNYACFTLPERCCDVEDLSVHGIRQHLIYLFLVGLLLFFIVLSMQSRLTDTILYTFIDLLRRSPSDNDIYDPDVLDETNKVRNEQINRRIYEVVLKDVTKYYKRTVAVNQLCLGLKEFECFGLVGTPGAGKSTALKLLAGQIKLSYGDAWISGYNLKKQMSKIRTCIGYCPQYDALFSELTGKETLIIYCLIRGIPITNCTATAKKLAKEFKFFKSLNQTVCYYSGGTKRKLSAAVALIGEPKIILLDEPTAGMDPHTKRFIWNSLSRIKDNGKCLIVVTDNMDECEAVCTRMGIMVDGSLQCLGAPHHLKNKYEGGYALTIKLSAIEESQLEEVDDYIQQNFSDVERRDVDEGVVLYILREMQHMYWSQLFQIMEDGKQNIAAIEDYWLSQFSLEQIYFLYTRSRYSRMIY